MKVVRLLICEDENKQRCHVIATLFGVYGQGGDSKRIALYVKMLEPLPLELLSKSAKKLILESKFLPSVSELVDAAQSLMGSVEDGSRIKTWAEAWGEIERAMYATAWGKTPEFSRPEITAAVNNYGWNTLQLSQQDKMPTVRAQIRRMYEDACARSKERMRNNFVLGNGNAGLIDTGTVFKQIGD